MKINSIIFALTLVLLLSSAINASQKTDLTGLANSAAGIALMISLPAQPEIPGPPAAPPAGPGPPVCLPVWGCGEWGGCENNAQTRKCTDTACNSPEILETRDCISIRYIGDLEREMSLGKEGIFYSTVEKEKVIFTVKSINHTATIMEVHPTYIDVEIQSEKIVLRINIHDTVYVDLEKDRIYDLSITVHDIKDGRASITIKQILIPPVIINAPAMPAVSIKNLYLTLFLVFIILAILALFFATKKKRVKKKKKR